MKTDTVVVNRDVHFEQIAQVLNININHLRDLNPQYRRDIINGLNKRMAVRLPLVIASCKNGVNLFLGHAQLGGGKLRLRDLEVGGAGAQELLMRALAGHAALIQDDDLVGVHDGRDALPHDDQGGVCLRAGKLFSQAGVCLVVKRAK